MRTELQRDPTLSGLPLPHRSQLALLFKTECLDLVSAAPPRPAPAPAPPTPSAVHECWQLDFQEAIPLAEARRTSICTIRDPFGRPSSPLRLLM